MWSLLKLLIVPAVEFVHRVELFLLFLTLGTTGSGSHLSLFHPLLSLVTETPGMAFNSALWTLIALLHFKRNDKSWEERHRNRAHSGVSEHLPT